MCINLNIFASLIKKVIMHWLNTTCFWKSSLIAEQTQVDQIHFDVKIPLMPKPWLLVTLWSFWSYCNISDLSTSSPQIETYRFHIDFTVTPFACHVMAICTVRVVFLLQSFHILVTVLFRGFLNMLFICFGIYPILYSVLSNFYKNWRGLLLFKQMNNIYFII